MIEDDLPWARIIRSTPLANSAYLPNYDSQEVKWGYDVYFDDDSQAHSSSSHPLAQKEETYIDLEMGVSQSNGSADENNQSLTEKQAVSSSSNYSNFLTLAENIGGNILSLAGTPIAATGGVLIFAYPDLSLLLGKIGFGLGAIGVTMDKIGSLLLERSQKEAASILFKMRTHAKDIDAHDLSPKKLKKLSSEFFGMNERYQSILGRTSKAGRFISKALWVAGPTVAVVGFGLTFTGDTQLGPVMAVAGATAFSVGESLKKKADAYEEQLELCEAVKNAEQRISNKKSFKNKSKKKKYENIL